MFQLINWEEGNYRVTDKPLPRGEIIIGGGNVASCYYKLPGKTEEEFFHNSFLRLIKEEKKCYRFLLIFHQKSLSFKQKENKSVSYSEIHSIIIGGK